MHTTLCSPWAISPERKPDRFVARDLEGRRSDHRDHPQRPTPHSRRSTFDQSAPPVARTEQEILEADWDLVKEQDDVEVASRRESLVMFGHIRGDRPDLVAIGLHFV